MAAGTAAQCDGECSRTPPHRCNSISLATFFVQLRLNSLPRYESVVENGLHEACGIVLQDIGRKYSRLSIFSHDSVFIPSDGGDLTSRVRVRLHQLEGTLFGRFIQDLHKAFFSPGLVQDEYPCLLYALHI